MHRRADIIGLSALSVLFLVACDPQAGQQQEAEPGVMDGQQQQEQQQQAEQSPFQEWDANQDQALQQQEFTNWSTEENALEGITNEQGLDRQAFQERLQEVWDVDSNGSISEAEWQSGSQNLFGDTPHGTFEQWDANSDGQLSAQEMAAAIEVHGLYAEIDADGNSTIERQEVGEFFFDVFDTNDDDELDATEWDSGRGTWLEGGLQM